MSADTPQPAAVFHGALGVLDQGLLKVEEFILSYGVLALASLLMANVGTRILLGESIMFVQEISQALVVIVTFLGLGYCARKARHIRMSALYDIMPDKARKAMVILMALVTCAVLVAMTWWSFQYLVKVKTAANVTPILRMPVWFVNVWVPVGFAMAAIEYALTVYKNLISPEVWLSMETPDGYEDESLACDQSTACAATCAEPAGEGE